MALSWLRPIRSRALFLGMRIVQIKVVRELPPFNRQSRPECRSRDQDRGPRAPGSPLSRQAYSRFSYQKAEPGGRSLRVLSRSNIRPAAASLAQRGRPQPSHGIAEMVDVDDLTEVVRPVRKRAVAKYLAGLEAETRFENGQQAPFAQVDHANQFPLARSELSFCNKANIARGPSPLFDLYQREPFARAVSVADPPFAQ